MKGSIKLNFTFRKVSVKSRKSELYVTFTLPLCQRIFAFSCCELLLLNVGTLVAHSKYIISRSADRFLLNAGIQSFFLFEGVFKLAKGQGLLVFPSMTWNRYTISF